MTQSRQDQPPRTGWQAIRAAVRWRYTEPETVADVLAGLDEQTSAVPAPRGDGQ